MVWERPRGQDVLMLCVFDGHGPQGHAVSGNVAAKLPTLLAAPPLRRLEEVGGWA